MSGQQFLGAVITGSEVEGAMQGATWLDSEPRPAQLLANAGLPAHPGAVVPRAEDPRHLAMTERYKLIHHFFDSRQRIGRHGVGVDRRGGSVEVHEGDGSIPEADGKDRICGG